VPLALVLVALAGLAAQRSSDPVAAWTDDVMFLVSELERMHPDPFFGCPRPEFEAAVDGFMAEIEEDGAKNATIELMRLMGKLSCKGREGHAVVWPMNARSVPLQLYRFDDGWFVVDAEGEQRDWIGARLMAIGGVPVEEVCKRIDPLLSRDNEWNLLLKLGASLLCGDVLAGVGVVPDAARVRLEFLRDGKSTSVEMATVTADPSHLWARQPLPTRDGVTWLEGREESWRLQVLEPEHALYVQYNEVAPVDHDQKPLVDFAKEIVRTFEEQKLARVIVDVRSNGGGNNTTFPPLIQALQTPSIDRPGVLYGLIGRATFSAAGNFVTVLDRDTKATLVGEPTGGAPNQYGDARNVVLPNHPDVLVRIATRYHQFGGPADTRLTHEPDLRVPLTSADYFAGRDPVLRAALEHETR